MSTILNENPAFDKMVNAVAEVSYLKRKVMRKIHSVSGVDVLGGVLDTVEKVDKSIDNIPHYDKVERLAQRSFNSQSDDVLNLLLARHSSESIKFAYQAVTGKALARNLVNRELKKSGRIISGCYVAPSVAYTLLLLVEMRRRRNANESPPNQVKIPDEVVEIFARQNPNMLKHLFGNE